MYQAELVCFAKGTTCQSYRGNEFQELSFVGFSYISEEDALKNAYKEAFEKYGITSDEIKRTKTWHKANYQKKLDEYGFGTLINNQHGKKARA